MKQVCYCRDEMEAGFLKGHLEQEGIEAQIMGETLSFARGDLPLTPQTMPSLHVAEQDLQRACEIVYRLLDHQPDADGPTWPCPNCSEQVEPQFAQCWNCGETRPESP